MSRPLVKTSQIVSNKQSPSKQYDLFTTFFGDAKELSNTIEFWDAIPKYAVTPRRMSAMRDSNGRLPVHAQSFQYRPRVKDAKAGPLNCKVSIQPASINVKGSYIDFYPSTDEEIIEEVLKKIFSDQQYGFHDPREKESWVKFTLYMIRKELRERGKTRSLQEIRQSLEILSRSVYEVEIEGKAARRLVYTNPILNDLSRVTREDYLDDPKNMWLARLPVLVSQSINDLSYRQFNYGVLMSLSRPLSRWLHKRLSHNYTNASVMTPFHILYSSLERDSGLLQHPRKSANLKTVEEVLEELQNHHVILSYTSDVRRQGRKIIDVLYELTAHPDFVRDVKAANARAKQAENQALKELT